MIKMHISKAQAGRICDMTSAVDRVYQSYVVMLMLLENEMGAVGLDLMLHRCEFMQQLVTGPENLPAGAPDDTMDRTEKDAGPFAPFRVTHAKLARKNRKNGVDMNIHL